jgi:hypothetical protein
MASEAQIRANRENSLKSTGPKTEEGKNRSRANSLKHGLCASAVVPEDLELLKRRSFECYDGLRPKDNYQGWIVDQVAVLSVRVDRCSRMERRARDKVCLRACLTWDDDRNLEAISLGNRLASNPSEIVEVLKRTPHGCDWLIDRWSRLADAARDSSTWTDEQARLALDLLAVPSAFRSGRKPWAAKGGVEAAPGDDLVAFAARQVEELKRRREVALELDEVERALAVADLSNGTDPEVRRIRRYEAGLHRQIKWCIAQIHNPTPNKIRPAHVNPSWSSDYQPIALRQPEPKTADEVAAEGWKPEMISPPFDLEPDEFPEPGQVADIPKILRSRKQKRQARAESRRESKRRKLDQLQS